MAAARVNPTAVPSSGNVVRVLNSSNALVSLGTGSGAAGAYTNVTLAFNASSMAPLVINYADAGSIALFARYQLPSPPSGILSRVPRRLRGPAIRVAHCRAADGTQRTNEYRIREGGSDVAPQHNRQRGGFEVETTATITASGHDAALIGNR